MIKFCSYITPALPDCIRYGYKVKNRKINFKKLKCIIFKNLFHYLLRKFLDFITIPDKNQSGRGETIYEQNLIIQRGGKQKLSITKYSTTRRRGGSLNRQNFLVKTLGLCPNTRKGIIPLTLTLKLIVYWRKCRKGKL